MQANQLISLLTNYVEETPNAEVFRDARSYGNLSERKAARETCRPDELTRTIFSSNWAQGVQLHHTFLRI